LLIGVALRFTARGFLPELLIEIPFYQIPSAHALVSKMWMRICGFLREALPIIAGAVLFVNILYQFKLFEYLARLVAPVITRL
jgi:ferrous iron transport protein B